VGKSGSGVTVMNIQPKLRELRLEDQQRERIHETAENTLRNEAHLISQTQIGP
jgi:hypothetical protein